MISGRKERYPVVLRDHLTPFLRPSVTNWASQWAASQNMSALGSAERGPSKSPQHWNQSVCVTCVCVCLHVWNGTKWTTWWWLRLSVWMRAAKRCSRRRARRGRRAGWGLSWVRVWVDARWHSRRQAERRGCRLGHTGTFLLFLKFSADIIRKIPY